MFRKLQAAHPARADAATAVPAHTCGTQTYSPGKV